jgi:hypothetical protein
MRPCARRSRLTREATGRAGVEDDSAQAACRRDRWFLDRKKIRGAYTPPTAKNSPMFAGKGIELFDIVLAMDGLGVFDEEKKHAVKIPLGRIKVLVLKLERIIASKEAAGREKDRLVLKVLSDALKAIQEREVRP